MAIVEHEVSAPDTTRRDAREERARILEAAALEIEVHGWTTGTPCDDDGRMCLMGAIAAVRGQGGNWLGVMQAWSPTWLDDWPEIHEAELLPLAVWNDYSAESADEVTFLLRWRAQEIRDGR